MHNIYIGLMSGTSMDGVDGVIVDFSPSSAARPFQVLGHTSCPMPSDLREPLMALNTCGVDELHKAAIAANHLSRLYADVVTALLHQTGRQAHEVIAIGSHGQTVRHQPGMHDGTGYTLQLGNPALLAELTGITVVADFRSRDIAAGGQGAPLVPAFHQHAFATTNTHPLILNIGGIANLTVLPGNGQQVLGFDCGPGNALMDYWCHQHTGQAFDDGGAWGATGSVIPTLLAHWLTEPYFAKPAPKSTGRDLFNPQWLHQSLADTAPSLQDLWPAHDVQATLTELTARTCAQAAQAYSQAGDVVAVCGGGALNKLLMHKIAALLPGRVVVTTDALGLPVMQVEATAFAWLAKQAVERQPASLPSVTGAKNARILGAIYPA